MLSFEEFSSGKNWAFTETVNGGFIVASSPLPDNRYEVMFERLNADGTKRLEYEQVDGIENCFAAVVSKLAAYAEHIVGAPKERPDYVPIALAVERGGFKPGTFDPYGHRRYLAAVFLSPSNDGMLMAGRPFHAENRTVATTFLQLRRAEDGWEPTEVTPEFVEVVEASYCQWAREALASQGLVDAGSHSPA